MKRPENLPEHQVTAVKEMTFFVSNFLSERQLKDILKRVQKGEINGNTFQYPVDSPLITDPANEIRLKRANAWLVGVSLGDTPETNFRLQELEGWLKEILDERTIIEKIERFIDFLSDHELEVFVNIATKTPRRFETLSRDELSRRQHNKKPRRRKSAA